MKNVPKDNMAVISFGDGSLAYRRAAKRVIDQSQLFSQVSLGLAVNKKILRNFSIEDSKRVSWSDPNLGFYAWKPLTLLYALKKLPPRIEYIFYADSGCWFNFTKSSEVRLDEYLAIVKESGGLTFSSGYPEIKFTKKELINEMNPPEYYLETDQIAATQWIMKRDTANDFSKKWWEYSSQIHLINDEFNLEIQNLEFIAHRHDQSIFSLLSKNYKIPMHADNIEIHPHKKKITEVELAIPVWATRHRSGSKSLSMNFFRRAIRGLEQNIP